MIKTITVIKQNQKHVTDMFKDGIKTDIVFREIQRDTVGKSGASPTWGYTYYNVDGKMKFKGIALHKEYDYDFPKAAYGEKVWSIFGTELLGESVRVPNIELVEHYKGYPEIISYRLMDNNKEDMIHIEDILFNKFQREEMKSKRNIYNIDEILECARIQIGDEQNYKKIEKAMIQVLLLDAITNNGDRHALNWGLVRGEKTNEYSLAVFDHASSFVDMFEDRSYFLGNGWSSSYVIAGNSSGKYYIGSNGKQIIEYIAKKYPEYFEDFCEKFEAKLPKILENIEKEKMKIDFKRVTKKMEERKKFLRKLKSREEFEYGE